MIEARLLQASGLDRRWFDLDRGSYTTQAFPRFSSLNLLLSSELIRSRPGSPSVSRALILFRLPQGIFAISHQMAILERRSPERAALEASVRLPLGHEFKVSLVQLVNLLSGGDGGCGRDDWDGKMVKTIKFTKISEKEKNVEMGTMVESRRWHTCKISMTEMVQWRNWLSMSFWE